MRETELLEEALRAGGDVARERYASREQLDVSSKRDGNDLVTEADVAVQERVVETIRRAFPRDAILAEESGLHEMRHEASARCWLIDPIDGTQNFVRGMYPAFGVSVAFAEGGAVQSGGVYFPMPASLYIAERGGGAFRDGRRVAVSDVDDLTLARGEIDFGNRWVREGIVGRGSRLMVQLGQVRCYCSAVVGLCELASGNTDAYFHVYLHPWDYAAGMLIAEEAGAQFTDLDGGTVGPFDCSKGILGTNGKLHDQALAVIDSGPTGAP
jgi:myo-inositol-1(or 4)-monophosphatase